MSTNTSIGPGANRGSNDNPGNADGCGNKTLGDQATHEPPADARDATAPADARNQGRAPAKPSNDR